MYSPKIFFFFRNCDNNTGLIQLLTLKKNMPSTFLWNILTLQGNSDRNSIGYTGYPHEQKTGHGL